MKQLGSLADGEKVKIKINGTARNFLVVQQGKPTSSLYSGVPEDSTWLMMEDIHTTSQWNSTTNNNYAESTINAYLKGSFFGQIEGSVRNQIVQISLPYGLGNSTSTVNRMSTKVFLLAWRELDINTSAAHAADGSSLSYFSDAGDGKRIAYFNGAETRYWLRTPYTKDSTAPTYASFVTQHGGGGGSTPISEYGIRPAFILPQSMFVDDDGSVAANTAPTAPENIVVPASAKSGEKIDISWNPSTDTENNLEGYTAERSTDGATWEEVFKGEHTGCTDTIPHATSSVQYRIQAYDNEGLVGDWGYSNTVQVRSSIILQLKEPIPVDRRPTKCIVKVEGTYPSGSELSVQICNNGYDDMPTWEDITNQALNGLNFTFINEEKEAEQWGVDIKASLDRGDATGDCHIDSIRINSMNMVSGGVDLEELEKMLAELKADILGSMNLKTEEIKALINAGKAKVIVKGTAQYIYAADMSGVKDVSIQVRQYNFDPAKSFVVLNGGQPTDYTSNVSYVALTDEYLTVRIYLANNSAPCHVSYQIIQLL